jgi:hypothetical protein
MSIDISNQTYISLIDAANRLPGRPHISTLQRWRQRGVKGVKLVTIKAGGRTLVAVEELERFIAATTAAAAGQPQPIRTARQRERAIMAAERELAGEGVGATRGGNRKT